MLAGRRFVDFPHEETVEPDGHSNHEQDASDAEQSVVGGKKVNKGFHGFTPLHF